jgi:hypothetical protein
MQQQKRLQLLITINPFLFPNWFIEQGATVTHSIRFDHPTVDRTFPLTIKHETPPTMIRSSLLLRKLPLRQRHMHNGLTRSHPVSFQTINDTKQYYHTTSRIYDALDMKDTFLRRHCT